MPRPNVQHDRRRGAADELRSASPPPSDPLADLSGIVAHELNNLLTALFGQTEIAELQPDDREHVANCLREIRGAAQRAQVFARQLMTFAGRGAVHPRRISLATTAAALRDSLARLAGEKIRIEMHAEPESGEVWLDPAQLEQLLANLCEFARDRMPAGGTISFRASAAAEHADRPGGPPIAGEFVELIVAHDGAALSSDEVARAFEPCASIGRSAAARLALPTARRIVERAGGSLAIASRPGEQTRIRIVLPRAADHAAARAPHDDPPEAACGETVMVVEDEAVVRTALATVLRRDGYRVLEADSGDEALRMLADENSHPELIVSDMLMPGVDGRELARRVSQARPGVAILLISGYLGDAVIRDGKIDGELEFLQKPFSRQALAQRVRAILDQRRKSPR